MNEIFRSFCLGVVFTAAPQKTDGSRAFFTKYDQKPDKLPIRYFIQLKSEDLQSVDFYDTHGTELELFCQNKVAFRRSKFKNIILKLLTINILDVQRLARPYLFVDLPMTPGDELYIRILAIDPNYRTP
jgi:hypothetical protein